MSEKKKPGIIVYFEIASYDFFTEEVWQVMTDWHPG